MLEPFHLQLTLARGVPPAWVQLAGRLPVRHADDGAWVELGASRLSIERVAAPIAPADSFQADGADSGHPGPTDSADLDRAELAPDRSTTLGAEIVVRRLRIAPVDPIEPVAWPADATDLGRNRSRSGSGAALLVPAIIALTVGVAVATWMGQLMFAVMGAVGFSVALGTFVTGKVGDRRHRRAAERAMAADATALDVEIACRLAALTHHLRGTRPGIVGALSALVERRPVVWERRADHVDGFSAIAGHGTSTWDPGINDRRPLAVVDVPIAVEAGSAARVAVSGPFAAAVTRSIVVQLAVTTGPADWALVIVSDVPAKWAWAMGLPHLQIASSGCHVHTDDALAELVCEPTRLAGRHIIVVTDRPDGLAVRTGAVRRLINAVPDLALLVELDHRSAAPPALCRTVLVTTTDGRARLTSDVTTDAGPVQLRIAGLSETAATAATRLLAPLIDPEAPDHGERSIPTEVELSDVLRGEAVPIGAAPSDAAAILGRWRAGGVDARPCSPIGVAADGVVDLDLVRDGPHGLIAGTTGSGKSELLRSVVLGMCAAVAPDQVNFVLVDFKGGATFDGLAALPHVVGVVTDLDLHLAERMLRSLRAEVVAREHVLRTHGGSDLSALRMLTGAPTMPRLVVIVDEFAALAVDQPELLHALIDVARRGRSLGVHLLLATQRPSGVVSDEIRTNTDLRIALRVIDASDAMDVVGDPAPARLRRSSPGRCVMRLGPSELITFQSARCSDPTPLIQAIVEAAESYGGPEPKRPWCDPLPNELAHDSVAVRALGIVDLPDQQMQLPLHWSPGDGHVLIVGSRGSGVTTALGSVALRTLPDDGELLVIDALGDPRWDEVALHPRCVAVVQPHRNERLIRLLRRAVSPAPTGGRIVVVDGVGALRRELEPVARMHEFELLESLVATPMPGVTLIVGNEGASGLGSALIPRFANRWLLHLHDPAEAGIIGLRAADNPPAVPGRMMDVTTAAQAQLVSWPQPIRAATPRRRVTWLDRLAELDTCVDGALLPASIVDDHIWQPTVGIGFDTLQPVTLDVPEGDHLLVIGPARSGRSHALLRLATCWRDAHPDGVVVVVTPRRSPLSGAEFGERVVDLEAALARVEELLGDGTRVLLAVDDAELANDGGGRLATLLAAAPHGFTVAVAGRADAMRATYGHWTAAVRRSRRGIVMAGAHDADVDLLAATLPRWRPLPPRPGLCWIVGDGQPVLAQVALPQLARPGGACVVVPTLGRIVAADDPTPHRRRRSARASAA
jgi:DNA segregation ATPase FtsK/SpoIIIE, S-DNA-T family